ncbi:hypothetical protein AB0D08_39650 [Kitasatospora sp. NPDC048540]|uniref:hypothetical protein n=1 Tax=unclassified Kitasatospora TaxID=2633591 RepID=UPI00053BB4EF|nr:hypothetical protein [Kitasatospora sp. MBT63]
MRTVAVALRDKGFDADDFLVEATATGTKVLGPARKFAGRHRERWDHESAYCEIRDGDPLNLTVSRFPF